jgi:predicted dehydrogenase
MSTIKNSEPIRWGIIGCGDVTEIKSGPAFNKVPGSSLVAVMRRDGAKAKDYAERHRVPTWYDDAAKLINDPAVNTIYVATPPGSHEEYTIAALHAGKPVYVEKPMSVNTASCIRMQQAADAVNGKLTIAHYRRALPMFIKIKELIDTGAIGAIRTIRLSLLQPDKSAMIANTSNNWRVNPAIAGAGLFYDLAPHQLDILIYFFGSPIEAKGISANQAGLYQTEDVVTGIMHLPKDILFTGQWCFTVNEREQKDLVEIVGASGKISFPVFGHSVTIFTNEGKKEYNFQPPAHIQQPMIEKVVQYFLDQGQNPCSATDALESMSVMENFVYGGKDYKD